MTYLTSTRQHISRRQFWLGAVLLAPFPALSARLFYLQNTTGDRYRKLAEQNRIHIRPVPPERGLILDTIGRPVAENLPTYRLTLIKEHCPDPKETLTRLARITNLSDARIARILKDLTSQPAFMPVVVFKTLPFETMATVQANLPELPGLDLSPFMLRTYPHESQMAHLAGYVGPPTQKDVEESNRTNAPRPLAVGKRGVEKSFDEKLNGHFGSRQVEVNAFGRELRELSRQPPKKGRPVHLTIHAGLQNAVWDRFKKKNYKGAGIVMDAHTGELITAVSHPAFDPNHFVEGISTGNWKNLLENPYKPLLDRCFYGQYSPGSTFKLLTALAALEEGLAKPSEVIHCRGHMQLGNRRFHCWKRHGSVNLHQAVARSCDIYFYELGRRLGIDTLAEYARRLGFGQNFEDSLTLPHALGLVPDTQWKLETRKEPWAQGETLITAIGQGPLLATPLHMATMTARILTGQPVTPHLVRGNLPKNNKASGTFKPLSPQHLAFLKKAMLAAVHEPHGTAVRARPKGFKMGGKTGTVQVISQRFGNEYDINSIPEKQRPHGMFVGFTESAELQKTLVVTTCLEHVGSGGGVAAPAARDILTAAYEHLPRPPKPPNEPHQEDFSS